MPRYSSCCVTFVPPFTGWVDTMNEFHFLGAVFALLLATMLLIRALRPLERDFIQQDVRAVDMTPWKHALVAGSVLVVAVCAIYAAFGEF